MIRTADVAKFVSLLAYFWLLMLAYSELGVFGSFNLTMYTFDFDVGRFLIAHAVLLFLAFLIPSKPKIVSDYFLWLHLVFPVMPMLVFYSYSGGTHAFLLLSVFAYFSISVLAKQPIIVQLDRFSFRWPIVSVWALALMLTAFILVNGSYLSLDYSLETIYSNRAEISENQPAIFEYIHTGLSKSLLPFLLLFYLAKGARMLFLLAAMFSMAVFILSQHRAALFYPVLTLVCYYASRLAGARAGWAFTVIFASVVVFGVILLQFDQARLLGDLILRRTFFAPAILNYQYFEFFQASPHTWFSDSKLSFGLVDPVYSASVPYIIGDYIGLPGGHANSSYLGSGYQQAGWVGVAIYVLVIGILLKYLDAIGVAVGSHPFAFGVCASPLLWLINSSDLPGVFLTHGLLSSLFILWISSSEIRRRVFSRGALK